MHARLIMVQIQPGKTGELIQFMRDSLMPAAQEHQGFKGLLLLTDESSSKAVSVTLWETEADLKAGEASEGYYQQQLAKGMHLITAIPLCEHYQVSVSV